MTYDITFCNARCATNDCPRNLDRIDKEWLAKTSYMPSQAELWKSCPAYQPKKESEA